MSFKLTYATMFNPPADMHGRFDAALAEVNRAYGPLPSGEPTRGIGHHTLSNAHQFGVLPGELLRDGSGAAGRVPGARRLRRSSGRGRRASSLPAGKPDRTHVDLRGQTLEPEVQVCATASRVRKTEQPKPRRRIGTLNPRTGYWNRARPPGGVYQTRATE